MDHEEAGFYIRMLVGKWTKKHKGVASDAVAMFAFSLPRKYFCKAYGWPKQRAFYFNTYGIAESHTLVREICRKSNYLYLLWLTSEVDGFEFTEAAFNSYIPSDGFLNLFEALTVDDKAATAAMSIVHLWPRLKAED